SELTSHLELPEVLQHAPWSGKGDKNRVLFHKKLVFKIKSEEVYKEEYAIETLFCLALSNRVVPLLIVKNLSRKNLGIPNFSEEEAVAAIPIDRKSISRSLFAELFIALSYRKEILKRTSPTDTFPKVFEEERCHPWWLP